MNHATQTERMRLALAAGVALAMLVAIMLAATSALGGSGGVGGGDGGGPNSGGDRYARIWDKFSDKDQRWAHRTSQCESGDNPKIHGGGGAYHGAFQFMKSTWKSAPQSPGGDPHRYAWKTQAVVAVKLKQRDGARTHWPNCG